MRGTARSVVLYWLPAVGWSVLILAGSGDILSSAHSESWLRDLAVAVFKRSISPETFELAHYLIRKCAHVLVYAILSVLWLRALRGESRTPWTFRWAILSLAITATVASLDEFHQGMVPTRTGLFSDVLLDIAGATLAQLVIGLRRLRNGGGLDHR